jgi:hypothetical protein
VVAVFAPLGGNKLTRMKPLDGATCRDDDLWTVVGCNQQGFILQIAYFRKVLHFFIQFSKNVLHITKITALPGNPPMIKQQKNDFKNKFKK